MAGRSWHFSQTTKVIAHVTPIKMGGVHTGTHIDESFHFEPAEKTIDQLSIETLIGSCSIKEMLDVREIHRVF